MSYSMWRRSAKTVKGKGRRHRKHTRKPVGMVSIKKMKP